MNIDFKNKKELTFLAVGILMLIIVSASIILAIQFIISNMNKVFESRTMDRGDVIVEFQIKKAESLVE